MTIALEISLSHPEDLPFKLGMWYIRESGGLYDQPAVVLVINNINNCVFHGCSTYLNLLPAWNDALRVLVRPYLHPRSFPNRLEPENTPKPPTSTGDSRISEPFNSITPDSGIPNGFHLNQWCFFLVEFHPGLALVGSRQDRWKWWFNTIRAAWKWMSWSRKKWKS